MCAKVKMLPAIDVLVNCTLVLIKHKYSNCIHCIKRIPKELLLEVNRNTSALQRLTENSHQYGMVFNSGCLATSLQKTQPGSIPASVESSGQLFEKISCSVIPNNWINYILLTLQGILYYYWCLVLNTPHVAENVTPVSSAFFSSKDYLWLGSEQEYNTRKGNIVGRLHAVFKCPAAYRNSRLTTNITCRRPYHG
jgi:hypothetical protein